MSNNIIKRTWKQGGLVNIEDLRGSAFQAEDGGHTFLISGLDENGDALALSGTPAGVLLRADGQDVTLTCSVSDGVVSATLPANAYVVPGRVGITIFLTSGGQKTAIYAAVGSVATTSSGIVAPPAGSDVVDLVNAIATAVATIPASYTDLMAAVAPTYSTSALYAVGSYAWYSGKLYRCTTAITSGETWTSAHWTLANLGSDVSDLKSAVSPLFPANENIWTFNSGAYYNDSLELTANDSSVYSGAIPCAGYKKAIIKTPSMLVSNSSRCVGFKKKGVATSVYTIQSLVSRCTAVGDHYETELDIGENDTLFVSIQSNNVPLVVSLKPSKYDELDERIEDNTTNIEEINTKKLNEVYSDADHIQSFKTGYYYDNTLTKVSNSSSAYLEPFSCAGCEKVVIKTPNALVSNSSRHIGIKTNGEITGLYTIQSLVSLCVAVDDHYETVIPTGGGDTMYFSIQSDNIPFEITLLPDTFERNVRKMSYKTVYVSTDGDDRYSGETRATAMRTIQAAINSDAKIILVKEGQYAPFTMLEKDGVTISLDPYYSSYTAGSDEDNPKIVIGNAGETIGVNLNRCNNCKFIDIEVRNAPGIGFRVYRCSGCEFISCIAHDIGISSSESNIAGFMIQYSNANFYKCAVYNIGTTTAGTGSHHYDGFNIHYTGTTNFYDCSAWNCEDDGISHHDACRGLIDGGEWYNCGKGGIASPTHGAVVDVSNAYSHDNAYGIYCDTTGSIITENRPAIMITNCALKNNRLKDLLIGDFYHARVWNCIYGTAETGSNTVIME